MPFLFALIGCTGEVSQPNPLPAKPTTANSTATLAATTMVSTATKSAADLTTSSVSEKYGVQILNLRLTAEGYMLDFRFRILDADKAAPLLDRENKPYLIDQATGMKMYVPAPPRIGALRSRNVPAGRNAIIAFANPGQHLKRGGKATVVIGDFRAENLVVE